MIELAIHMVRGDTKILHCATFQQDGISPYDLAGCTLWMTAKAKINDPDVQATFQITSDDDITIDSGGSTGLFDIEIKPDKTDPLPVATTLAVDIQILTAAAKVFTLGKGSLSIEEDVTRTITPTP